MSQVELTIIDVDAKLKQRKQFRMKHASPAYSMGESVKIGV